MSIKKTYSGCLELLAHYDKHSLTKDGGWGDLSDLNREAPSERRADPHPTPEPPDDDMGPGGG